MWKFSNFANVEVEYGEVLYPTLEHAYQAAKTLDGEWREKILDAETPGKAKRLGGKAPLRPGWEQMKVGVMNELLHQKYAPGTEFREMLDATGDEEIVEWNWWHDNIWGKCTCSKCGKKGHNILGRLLMDIRDGVQQDYFYCPTHNHFGTSSCFSITPTTTKAAGREREVDQVVP